MSLEEPRAEQDIFDAARPGTHVIARIPSSVGTTDDGLV